MKSVFLTKDKIFINDSIYNTIELTIIAKTIIDNPTFQRLRYIKQLGVSYLIYPSANNTRFEHSIGTYHLAGLLLEKIKINSVNTEINKSLLEIKFIRNYLLKQNNLDNTEINILNLENSNIILLDDYLIELIKIAGLVHDLGHGPFSHLFDKWLHNKLDVKNSKLIDHESRSVILFKNIISNEKIKLDDEEYYLKEFIDLEAFEFISELINPNSNTPENFIFQIISNYSNSLDVDKLDYILRDSHYLNSGIPYELNKIISYVKVINNNICYPEKHAYEIYKIFRARYDLHKQHYCNKITICVEHMIIEILENLNPILEISDSIKNEDINKFIDLNDNFILFSANILKVNKECYNKWKKQIDNIIFITNKINNRNIYSCIYEETFSIEEDVNNQKLFENFKIKNNNNSFIFDFNSPNIIITKIKIGLISGNKSNPLNSIYIYQNDKIKLLDICKTSNLVSDIYQENVYYVIFKN